MSVGRVLSFVVLGLRNSNCIFSQIARLVVFTAPAADEIRKLHFVKLIVFAESACDNFSTPDCQVCGLDWVCHE